LQIQFTQKYTTSSGKVYEVGDTEHVANSVAEKLFFEGVAKRVEYKTHKEFLDAHEKHRQTWNPSTATAPQWAINESRDPRHRFIVVKTTPHEVLYFATPPAEAPAHVHQRFRDMVATDAQAYKDRSEYFDKVKAADVRRITGAESEAGAIAREIINGSR
jgi:hypothetical protein